MGKRIIKRMMGMCEDGSGSVLIWGGMEIEDVVMVVGVVCNDVVVVVVANDVAELEDQ